METFIQRLVFAGRRGCTRRAAVCEKVGRITFMLRRSAGIRTRFSPLGCSTRLSYNHREIPRAGATPDDGWIRTSDLAPQSCCRIADCGLAYPDYSQHPTGRDCADLLRGGHRPSAPLGHWFPGQPAVIGVFDVVLHHHSCTGSAAVFG